MKRYIKISLLINLVVAMVTGCVTAPPSHNSAFMQNVKWRESVGRYQGARNLLEEGILYAQKQNDYYSLASYYIEMGRTYMNQAIRKGVVHPEYRKPALARSNYIKAKNIAEQHHYYSILVLYYYNMAEVYRVENKPKQACAFLKKLNPLLNNAHNFTNREDKAQFNYMKAYVPKRKNQFEKDLNCS